MSPRILWELRYLFLAFVSGLWLMGAYDGLRVLRRVFCHRPWWVTAEDWAFGLGAGLTVFSFLFRQDDGRVRWYALFGIFLGMLFWNRAASPVLVPFFARVLGKTKRFLERIVDFLKKTCNRGLKKGNR